MHAAVTATWSNGPVEGHVNRLKTIKRQIYGRAGFVLLRRESSTSRDRERLLSATKTSPKSSASHSFAVAIYAGPFWKFCAFT